MTTVHAYAAQKAWWQLEKFDYELWDIWYDQVDIAVEFCGICHSDLSMINNERGMTQYPFVPWHEIIWTVESMWKWVKHLEIWQKVWVWRFSGSCHVCDQCVSWDQNLCNKWEWTIVWRHGWFANKVRVQDKWTFALPENIDASSAWPLFCWGATVFTPFVINNIKPTDKVWIIWIGWLWHMAILFANARGCEVTAFSTTPDKEQEAKELWAHHFVATKNNPQAFEGLAWTFDMILSTVNVPLDRNSYMQLLAPKGKLHSVWAQWDIAVNGFWMIMWQKSVWGSPVWNIGTTRKMIEFVARHNLKPMVEQYKIADINKAIKRLADWTPRYRVVLDCR